MGTSFDYPNIQVQGVRILPKGMESRPERVSAMTNLMLLAVSSSKRGSHLYIAHTSICNPDQESRSMRKVLDHLVVPFRSSWSADFTRVQRTRHSHASSVFGCSCSFDHLLSLRTSIKCDTYLPYLQNLCKHLAKEMAQYSIWEYTSARTKLMPTLA